MLDNDELIRMTWEMHAKKKNKSLKIYSHAEKLIQDLNQFEKDIPFYVDSNFGFDKDGNSIKGEEI